MFIRSSLLIFIALNSTALAAKAACSGNAPEKPQRMIRAKVTCGFGFINMVTSTQVIEGRESSGCAKVESIRGTISVGDYDFLMNLHFVSQNGFETLRVTHRPTGNITQWNAEDFRGFSETGEMDPPFYPRNVRWHTANAQDPKAGTVTVGCALRGITITDPL